MKDDDNNDYSIVDVFHDYGVSGSRRHAETPNSCPKSTIVTLESAAISLKAMSGGPSTRLGGGA